MSTDTFTDTAVAAGEHTYALDARNASGASAQGTPKSITVPGGTGSTFNVDNYGPVDPTGATLSTAAFLAALAAAEKRGVGSTVYAAKGHYLLDASGGKGSCLQVGASGIGFEGDGDTDDANGTVLIEAKVGLNPGTQRRPGIIGVPNGFDGIAIQGLYLDSRTNNWDGTKPQISKNPDPQILNISSSHNRVRHVSGKSGTGFCVRFTGPDPCYSFGVGDNWFEDGSLDALAWGGGFIALDCDCQGAFPTLPTLMTDNVIIGSMALYNDAHVTVNGLTFTPNMYQPACAPCIEITSEPGSASHDIDVSQGIVSNGGRIVNVHNNPITNLKLPSGQYWKAGC
jgi:hypothetical protein